MFYKEKLYIGQRVSRCNASYDKAARFSSFTLRNAFQKHFFDKDHVTMQVTNSLLELTLA